MVKIPRPLPKLNEIPYLYLRKVDLLRKRTKTVTYPLPIAR